MEKYFPAQQEDEQLLIVVREDLAVLGAKLLVWAILAAALIAFYTAAPTAAPWLFTGELLKVTMLGTYLYQMFLVLSLFLILVLYYLNVHIVTNLRIVDIDQIGLFGHTISELHIEKIEDVTSETRGVFGTLFDFGTVFVQTAGARERFAFENVPNPGKIAQVIADLYQEKSGKTLGKTIQE
jgi:hypothetical protein